MAERTGLTSRLDHLGTVWTLVLEFFFLEEDSEESTVANMALLEVPRYLDKITAQKYCSDLEDLLINLAVILVDWAFLTLVDWAVGRGEDSSSRFHHLHRTGEPWPVTCLAQFMSGLSKLERNCLQMVYPDTSFLLVVMPLVTIVAMHLLLVASCY